MRVSVCRAADLGDGLRCCADIALDAKTPRWKSALSRGSCRQLLRCGAHRLDCKLVQYSIHRLAFLPFLQFIVDHRSMAPAFTDL
jgi:hypothetical protein